MHCEHAFKLCILFSGDFDLLPYQLKSTWRHKIKLRVFMHFTKMKSERMKLLHLKSYLANAKLNGIMLSKKKKNTKKLNQNFGNAIY